MIDDLYRWKASGQWVLFFGRSGAVLIALRGNNGIHYPYIIRGQHIIQRIVYSINAKPRRLLWRQPSCPKLGLASPIPPMILRMIYIICYPSRSFRPSNTVQGTVVFHRRYHEASRWSSRSSIFPFWDNIGRWRGRADHLGSLIGQKQRYMALK